MEKQRLEYIRKNGRRNGRKKGVLWCGVDPNDAKSVIMGFTLCHSIDRYDHPGGDRDLGFGVKLSQIRAEKFRFHTDYFVQRTFTEEDMDDRDLLLMQYINPDTKSIVEIPPSVMVRLKTFIKRCKKYFKDKEFPVWVEKIELGDYYPYSKFETKIIDREKFGIY